MLLTLQTGSTGPCLCAHITHNANYIKWVCTVPLKSKHPQCQEPNKFAFYLRDQEF